VAIIQISRIQNRRGRKLTDVGMPQLSSGEIGWAIDTQELYIGNGSVSEGAPAVGNTKILTEHDDIFSLANKYKYKENNALWGNTTPAALTVQEKLDEWVSVRAFGALGDGTNQTASLQNAIDSLFIRAPSIKDNVKLYIPAGNYVIDGPLYVPPFAHIIGDGIGKTKITASDTAFITCNGTSVSGAYVTANSIGINEEDTNQARNIVISGMTITNDHVNPCFILNDTANSTFNNIEMTNTWLPGENEGNQVGFRITGTNTTPACTSENIHIHDISFSNFNAAIASDNDIQNIWIDNCYIEYTRRGIVFADLDNFVINSQGQFIGPSYCTVEKCVFDFIDKEGLYVGYGQNNKSENNKYLNVGNDDSNYNKPVTANIYFGNDTNNVSSNDFFKRFELLPVDQGSYASVMYVPEVIGAPYECVFAAECSLADIGSEAPFLKLPAIENGTVILYFNYRSHDVNDATQDAVIKQGTITMNVFNTDIGSLDPSAYTYVNFAEDSVLYDSGATLTDADFRFHGDISAYAKPVPDATVINLCTPVVKMTQSFGPLPDDSFKFTMKVLPNNLRTES